MLIGNTQSAEMKKSGNYKRMNVTAVREGSKGLTHEGEGSLKKCKSHNLDGFNK